VTAARTVPKTARSAGGVIGDPNTIRKIAMIGNHVPRQCGIATFTTDLSDALGDR
jgi:hypothetical protein